ncbi:MAG: hypothetical protein K2J82_07915 [Muribaculaceae bacterium]|nr:hypothetical protein [Muribaculaceae bacterium]MDE6754522.1 hypothetical protein [Muribaculaceae bacterium]
MEKTYIAPGMLDWQMCIPVGKSRVRINFTGGFMGPNGLVSSRFSTSDPALQRIIENSPQFERRRVVALI